MPLAWLVPRLVTELSIRQLCPLQLSIIDCADHRLWTMASKRQSIAAYQLANPGRGFSFVEISSKLERQSYLAGVAKQAR